MPDFNDQYFNLLLEFKDKIIIEVSAHDHYGDLRYHSNGDSSNKQFYHNLLVSPGLTPIDGSNPGVAFFEIDGTDLVPHSLKFLFLNLQTTYNLKQNTALPFHVVDIEKEFGLKDLTAPSLSAFKNKLEADDKLTYRYMVAKIGFNPDNKAEYD